jgi:acyl dehydratase
MADFHEGDVLPSLTKPPVTKTQLVMYSGASEDFNPIHTVDEFAVEAGLGGVIAHGMLSMAFIGQMLTDCLGEHGMLVDFGVRFQGMVRPGDTITCGGTVTKVVPETTVSRVFADVWAENDKGERVITGDAEFTINK